MPLNIDLQQIFLHLFNFTILLAALYFLLYGPVKAFMDKRTAHYEELDRQAQEKLEEAGRVQEEYRQKLEEADAEIRQKSAQAQQAASDAAGAQLQQAQEEAARIVAKARAEAQAERERLTGEARQEIAGMVTAAVEKLVLANTSSAYDQFLTAAEEDGGDE